MAHVQGEGQPPVIRPPMDEAAITRLDNAQAAPKLDGCGSLALARKEVQRARSHRP